MKKPINIRIDDYTQQLLNEMQKVDPTSDRSKIIRSAIEYYANYVLGNEEVMNIRMYQLFDKK